VKRVGVWGAALGAAVAAVLAYFWWVGAWPAMEEVQFKVLPRYNAMAIGRSQDYWALVGSHANRYLGPFTSITALAAIIVARRTRTLAQTLPVFLAALMGTVSLAMQARLPTYAFETCYPFYAMLWGYIGVKLFEGIRFAARWCSIRGLRIAAVMVWIVFANLVYLPLPNEIVQYKLFLYDLKPWMRDRNSFYANYPWAHPISHYDGQMHVIQYLRQKSAPEDGVFVWGSEPLIYFLAQRNPPTRFVSNLGLISLWAPPAWRLDLMRDLEAAPPQYIVVAREDWVPMISFNFLDSAAYLQQRFPALLAFVTSRYQKVDDYQDFVIYRHD
jgi:hypothetical protein